MDLAGVKVAIEVPPEWPTRESVGRERALESGWSPCSAAEAEIHVGVRVGAARSPLQDAFWYRGRDLTFEVGRCPGSPSRLGDWVVAVYGARGCERVARFDDALHDVDLVVDPAALAGLDHPLQDPIDEILLTHQLSASGGVLVRGSVSRGDSGGAVLTVRPHRAASNQSAPAEPAQSCDRVVIRLGHRDNEVWLHQTAWSELTPGRARANGRLRLEAVQVLEEASQPFREPLDADSAACELLPHASAPVHHPEGAESAASVIGRLAARVPVSRIGEPPTARAVPFTWAHSQAGLAFAPPPA